MSKDLLHASLYHGVITQSTRLNNIKRKKTNFIVDQTANLFEKVGEVWIHIKAKENFEFVDTLTDNIYLADVYKCKCILKENCSSSSSSSSSSSTISIPCSKPKPCPDSSSSTTCPKPQEPCKGDEKLFEELKREDLLSLNAEFKKEYIQIEGINPGDPFYV